MQVFLEFWYNCFNKAVVYCVKIYLHEMCNFYKYLRLNDARGKLFQTCFIDKVIGIFIDSTNDWYMDSLIDFMDWSYVWLIVWLTDWNIDCLTNWLNEWIIRWLIDWLVNLLID